MSSSRPWLGTWRFVLLVVAFLASVSSLGLAAPLRVPLDFEPYTLTLGPRSMVTRQDWWVVFADRDDVPVYADRHGAEIDPRLRLNLGKELWVLEEEQSSRMLLLGEFSSNPRDKEEPEITNTVGWVKWDHLILSREPLRDRETLVSRKAFVIREDWRRSWLSANSHLPISQVFVRAAPSADARVICSIASLAGMSAYIYKHGDHGLHSSRGPEWYLIGRRDYITPGSVEESVIGWIPARRLLPWDTRQALERIRDRQSPVHIYASETDLADSNATPLFEDLLNRDVWPPYKWRYPLLHATESQGQAQIGCLGPLRVPTEASDPGEHGGTEIVRVAAMTYAAMKNVNIIFVFDATTSMGPYLKAVATSLESVMSRLRAHPYHRDMRVRFGAVVYRDLKDIKKEQLQLQRLTPDHNTVVRFLKNQKSPSTAQDTDYPEAVFSGVEAALSKLAVADQTNILIVIGDAGNNDSDHRLSREFESDVARMAPRILAIHLQRPGKSPEETAAIAKFRPDLERVFAVVTEGCEKRQIQVRASWEESGRHALLPETPATRLWQTDLNCEDILGTQKVVERVLDEQLLLNSRMLDLLPLFLAGPDEGRSGGGGVDDDVRATLMDTLARFSGDPELLRILFSKKEQSFERGWVNIIDDDGRPLMRSVLLISLTELDQTERALLKLFPSGRDADPTDLLQSWRDIVGVILGDEPANVREYVDMVGGILFRENSPILALNFDEILDMSDEEFQAVLKYAKEALDRVGELRTNQEVWFEDYGDRYAWIPASELP